MKRSRQEVSPSSKRKHPHESSFKLNIFSRRLLQEWRRLDLPLSKATIVVAVSGGADSVALLLGMDELKRAGKLAVTIVIAHLNHKLRRASDADARWVQSLAKRLGHRAITASARVSERAARTGDNLEQAARRARYEFLEKTAKSVKANVLITAHTMDDQAETVLLNLLRGSGAEGLAGMKTVRSFSAANKLLLARPLISWARRENTEAFCHQRGIEYLVDEMNADESFARVRVRRQLLPLMKTFNPNFIGTIVRTSDILREESQSLEAAARRLLQLSAASNGRTSSSLQIDLLTMAEPALRRRALRMWLVDLRGDSRRLDRENILAIERLIKSNKSGRIVELPGGSTVLRRAGRLHLRK